MKYDLITILGPTATGKTRLAAYLAKKLNGEIISADSRQVYKFMNIGTGKDLADYSVDGVTIPYHLIDVVEPTEEYNLFRFNKDFYLVCDQIKESGKVPFLVGGTGLYLSSVLQNYKLKQADFSEEKKKELERLSEENLRKILIRLKPRQHNITDLRDKKRLITAIQIEKAKHSKIHKGDKPLSSLNIGIKPEREEIKKRITNRLKKRLDEGMIEEVKNLLDRGITQDKLFFFGLEYKYIGLYLNGEINYNDMYQKLNGAIHNFAKRQMTWFRKMEREGLIINWFDGKNYENILSFVEKRIIKDAEPSR